MSDNENATVDAATTEPGSEIKKRKRLALDDSDSESDTEPAAAPVAKPDDASSSTIAPKNSSRTIANDSDDSNDAAEPSDEPTAPADAADSDDEGELKMAEEPAAAAAVDSDSDLDSDVVSKPTVNAKEQELAAIFGDDSDSSSDSDDGDGGSGWAGFGEDEFKETVTTKGSGDSSKKKKEPKKRRRSTPEPEEDAGPKTQFELVMEKRKKAMQRKRKKVDSEDISNATGTFEAVKSLKDVMRTAWEMDEKHLTEQKKKPSHMKKPALAKLSKLDYVVTELRKDSMREDLVDQNIFDEISHWLMLGERAALPHVLIRNKLVTIVHASFMDADLHFIKSSKIGQVLNMLKQHPLETRENKKKIALVLNAWARMVFGSRADASSASAEDRMAHAAATTNKSMRQRRPSQETADEEPVRRPGEQGFVMRARVPMAAARDYTKRPEPKQAVLDKIGDDLEKLQGTRKAYIKKAAGSFDLMARKLKDKTLGSAKHKQHARSVNLSNKG